MSSPTPDLNRLNTPLSDEEVEELDEFLLSDATSENTMSLDMLDGYLTAIVIGPSTIPPSQWLPAVWGDSEDDAPEFESEDQAKRILELLLRHMNGIIWDLEDDADAFDPLFYTVIDEKDHREYLDGEMWASGFMTGMVLCREDWKPLFGDPAGKEALQPIYVLGADEESEEIEDLTRSPEQREALTKQIAASVASIYRFWLPRRQEQNERVVTEPIPRNALTIGRKDLCPCGSGKKFDECCGLKPTVH